MRLRGRRAPDGTPPQEREPDYRFTLANERTFLAWIRTALALLAGAIAIDQFLPELAFAGVRRVVAALLAVLGIGVAVAATRRWRANQRAMRRAESLPRNRVPAVLAAGLVVLTAFVVVMIVVQHGGR